MKNLKRFNEHNSGNDQHEFVKDVFLDLRDDFTEYGFLFIDGGNSIQVNITKRNNNGDILYGTEVYSSGLFDKEMREIERISKLLSDVGSCGETLINSDFVKSVNYTYDISLGNPNILVSIEYTGTGGDVTLDEVFKESGQILYIFTSNLKKYFKGFGLDVAHIYLETDEEGTYFSLVVRFNGSDVDLEDVEEFLGDEISDNKYSVEDIYMSSGDSIGMVFQSHIRYEGFKIKII